MREFVTVSLFVVVLPDTIKLAETDIRPFADTVPFNIVVVAADEPNLVAPSDTNLTLAVIVFAYSLDSSIAN